jgi:hypothetical protein
MGRDCPIVFWSSPTPNMARPQLSIESVCRKADTVNMKLATAKQVSGHRLDRYRPSLRAMESNPCGPALVGTPKAFWRAEPIAAGTGSAPACCLPIALLRTQSCKLPIRGGRADARRRRAAGQAPAPCRSRKPCAPGNPAPTPGRVRSKARLPQSTPQAPKPWRERNSRCCIGRSPASPRRNNGRRPRGARPAARRRQSCRLRRSRRSWAAGRCRGPEALPWHELLQSGHERNSFPFGRARSHSVQRQCLASFARAGARPDARPKPS